MKPLKILSITPTFNLCGGIESYSMNYYRHMSGNIHMDFITHDCTDPDLRREVKANGDHVYVLPPFSAKEYPHTLGILRKFFRKKGHNYDILHCNMANAACFYFPLAKRAGIPVRILHSHQDKAADTFSHAVRNIPLLAAGERMATHRLACSRQAGDFLFPKKDYTVIRNAIDAEHYRFDTEKRQTTREKYDLGDSIVLGTIGRLTEQKNQRKLIDILDVLVHQMNLNYKLLIVGEGHLLDDLVFHTAELSLDDRVTFTGSLADVTGVLSAMDIFVLPSLYEGLGIVNIEAQACGLPTVVSDHVPDEADMGGAFSKIPLNASHELWAKHIKKISPATEQERLSAKHIRRIREHGYDIATEAEKLEEFYFHSVKCSFIA